MRLVEICMTNYVGMYSLGLRKKNLSAGSEDSMNRPGSGVPGSIELFSTTDVVVKHVLEVNNLFVLFFEYDCWKWKSLLLLINSDVFINLFISRDTTVGLTGPVSTHPCPW